MDYSDENYTATITQLDSQDTAVMIKPDRVVIVEAATDNDVIPHYEGKGFARAIAGDVPEETMRNYVLHRTFGYLPKQNYVPVSDKERYFRDY